MPFFSSFQSNFETMFREYEPNATFHYLRSFRRVRVDFEEHIAASSAKLSLDGTPLGNNVIHCYFLQVKPIKSFFNRARERNWYIMSPMKNPKRWFFGFNIKFSMCRDYTKKISKIAPCAKGEKKYANIQVIWTIIFKISNLEANLEILKIIVRITCIFAYFFSPFAHGAILEKNFV